MSTSTTKLSPSARVHRDARFREIASRITANLLFHISQQDSRGTTLILARRFQHPDDPPTQPFLEAITPGINSKSPYVSRYIERIEEINRNINPMSSSSSPSSSSSSAPPALFLVTPDPYFAQAFKRSSALQRLKIPKLKPPVKPTVELEEGEILEDDPAAKPAPSTSRPVGGNLTNAAPLSALAHSVVQGTSGAGAGRATKNTSPRGRGSSSTSKSRTRTKENKSFDPRRKIPAPPSSSSPQSSKKAPSAMASSSSQTPSTKKATPVMASSPISIATSQIVTMRDIILAINPAYLLPDSIPFEIMPSLDPKSTAYSQQVSSLFDNLKMMFSNNNLIDGELEVLRTISSIINTTSVPHLPQYVVNALQQNASVVLDPEEVRKSQELQKLTVILSTILSLNEARLIAKKTEERMLGEEGEERTVVKVVKELERPSILAPILLEQGERSG